MVNLFLGPRWIGEALQRYRERPPLATVKGKPIVFSEREYAAALLHIYMGKGLNLSEIAELSRISMEHLSFQRNQIDFMALVDYLKTRFTAWYREILVIEEFSPAEYGAVSEEFLLLDDMVQTQTRVPLLTQLRQIGLSLESKMKASMPPDTYELRVFKHLLFFFCSVDRLRANAGHLIIEETLMPIARSVLDEDLAALDRQEAPACSEDEIRKKLFENLQEKIGVL